MRRLLAQWMALLAMTITLTAPLAARADHDLPVAGAVTSGVGWRLDPFGSGRLVYHRGTDIAVPVGTPVRSTRPGRVVHAGLHGGHGTTVIVEHENGDRTLYGHNSELTVREGERVEAGALIALSGNSGRSTGPHVHYELLAKGESLLASARMDEKKVRPRTSPAMDLRRSQEQRLEEAVNSILQTIGNSSGRAVGNTGQGG